MTRPERWRPHGHLGERASENDTANDWAYDLEEADDLSLVESAFDELDEAEDDDLDQDLARGESQDQGPRRC